MPRKKKDHYETLGVGKDADGETIKRAYRKRSRETHPDRNPGDKQSEDEFKAVNNAYMVLSDPTRRKRYDDVGDDDDSVKPNYFTLLSTLLSSILQEGFGKGQEPNTINVLHLMNQKLVSAMLAIDKNRDTAKRAIKYLKKAKALLKDKEDGILYSVIQRDIDETERSFRAFEDDHERHKQALAYLKQCKYDYDAKTTNFTATVKQGSGPLFWIQ